MAKGGGAVCKKQNRMTNSTESITHVIPFFPDVRFMFNQSFLRYSTSLRCLTPSRPLRGLKYKVGWCADIVVHWGHAFWMRSNTQNAQYALPLYMTMKLKQYSPYVARGLFGIRMCSSPLEWLSASSVKGIGLFVKKHFASLPILPYKVK